MQRVVSSPLQFEKLQRMNSNMANSGIGQKIVFRPEDALRAQTTIQNYNKNRTNKSYQICI
jgi:hypothetical protein